MYRVKRVLHSFYIFCKKIKANVQSKEGLSLFLHFFYKKIKANVQSKEGPSLFLHFFYKKKQMYTLYICKVCPIMRVLGIFFNKINKKAQPYHLCKTDPQD